MKRSDGWLAGAAALLALTPATADARARTVSVDAAAGPWRVDANKKLMPYGNGDQKPPAVIRFDIGGGRVAIFADGTTSVPDKAGIGPAGIDDDGVDDRLGPRKRRYPSFYTPKILYPAHRHALIATFVDAGDVVVGRPFVVGEGVRVPIPEGATGIALGFNDVAFAGNAGTLSVTVDIPDD